MIRLLSILILLFIHLSIYAQCINLQSGSACLNDDGETSLNFTLLNDCGNTSLTQLSVTSSDGNLDGILTQGVPPFMNFFNVLINQEGTYTISDGENETLDYIVYPKPQFTSTVSSEYYLCDDSVNVEFEILPANEFDNFSWIGSATESNNVLNGQFGDGYGNTFQVHILILVHIL